MDQERAVPDVEKIRSLIKVMERRGLSRLTLTEEGVTIQLEAASSTHTLPPPTSAIPAAHMPAVPSTHAAPAFEAIEPEPEGIPLLSPTTGTFYRSPAPGEPAFVEIGDIVEVGQTVGIIMAMKVMSEIPAEVAGEIVAISPADAELVQVGSVLMVVSPTE